MSRTFTGGDLTDTTAAAITYMKANNQFAFRDLYIIGDPNDPASTYLTNHEGPLQWGFFAGKTFQPAAYIKRSRTTYNIGFKADKMTVEWTPATPSSPFGQTVSTADPRVLAYNGYYDNWPFRVYRSLMIGNGDANTYGATPWWSGRISSVDVDRGKIILTINSFLDVMDEMVPINVISNGGTLASFSGATPPNGFTNIPYFTVFTGSTNNLVYGDVQAPFGSHHIFPANTFPRGYLVFINGPGSTLDGFWSPVALNADYNPSGTHYNAFTLYKSMPWPPTPWSGSAGDRFYVSAPAPVSLSEATAAGLSYLDFPYVPSPETAF